MVNRDIHKIDNWLIRMGWLGVAGLLFANGCTSTFANAGPLDLLNNAGFLAVAGGAIVLLAVGYSIRGRENRIVAVWDILEHSTEVSIPDLERSTGFERAFIESAVQTINRQPGCYYVLDDDAGMIVDGRMRSRVIIVERCESCGSSVNAHVSLDLPVAPACNHCGSPVASGDLNQLKLDKVDELRTHAQKKQKFSVLLFIVLLLIFWPAAVVYAIWASGAVDNLFKSA